MSPRPTGADFENRFTLNSLGRTPERGSDDARRDRPDHEREDAGEEAEAEDAVFAQARENRGERDEKRHRADERHDTRPTREDAAPKCQNSAARRNAAKPIAESRNGPAEALAMARVTTGFASAPSVVALEMITIAMVMPAMPVIAPANAARASSENRGLWSPRSRAQSGSLPRSGGTRSPQAASRTPRCGSSTGCRPPSSSSPDRAHRSRERRHRSRTTRQQRAPRTPPPTGPRAAATTAVDSRQLNGYADVMPSYGRQKRIGESFLKPQMAQ